MSVVYKRASYLFYFQCHLLFSVQEKTFRAGESITLADVTKTEMQYTFTEGDNIVFMNMETFEEQRMAKSKIENPLLLKDGKFHCCC